ncbi:MAG: tetratricopeptide repeat protein [Acidobacteria bacterium]|nr:tetratricopeptide repeat protein [Acidobacteriota bacterium]
MNRFPHLLRTTVGTCLRTLALALLVVSPLTAALAQSPDEDADPVQLFERGQNAHARGQLERALELYEEALKLRPDFPEAEYQRATALLSLRRDEEAVKSLRRAAELRAEWALPRALLGDTLVRLKRYQEAEEPLSQALKLEPRNAMALLALADLRLQTKASRENLTQLLAQLRAATTEAGATAGVWIARALIERELDERAAALASFERALALDDRNVVAYIERAETFASANETDKAIESARAAQRLQPASVYASAALTRFYLQAGNCAEATRTLDELDAVTKRPAETAALRSTIAARCAIDANDRSALEAALRQDPRNAPVLARLCALDRKDEPQRALDYCRRALEVEPRNADYGTSYGAALVQMRRFQDAAIVLQRVLTIAPENYTAHANLAVALYELKSFRAALDEYRWLLNAKPETTVAYFFIATAHDKLGEYPEALDAYETFLAKADPQQFKLEIEKVNLRLPTLRSQIKLGQGAKKKT